MATKDTTLALLRIGALEGRQVGLEEVRKVSEAGLRLYGVNNHFSNEFMSSEQGPPLFISRLYS